MGVFNATSIFGKFLGVNQANGDLVGEEGKVLVRHADNRVVVNDGASLTVTQDLHDGKTINAQGTGAAYTYTLPAATGSGMKLRLVIGEVNTSNTVIAVADATDVMYGSVVISQDGADTAVTFSTAADSDTITLNGTTTGGVAIGDFVDLEDIATNQWRVFGVLTGSGAEATPFSAAVA